MQDLGLTATHADTLQIRLLHGRTGISHKDVQPRLWKGPCDAQSQNRSQSLWFRDLCSQHNALHTRFVDCRITLGPKQAKNHKNPQSNPPKPAANCPPMYLAAWLGCSSSMFKLLVRVIAHSTMSANTACESLQRGQQQGTFMHTRRFDGQVIMSSTWPPHACTPHHPSLETRRVPP